MKKKIHNVCRQCGIAANVLTCIKRFGNVPNKLCFDVSTFHDGTCDVCDRFASCTEPRDFFYPDFSLLEPKILLEIKDVLEK